MVKFGRNVEWIVEVPVPVRVTNRNVSTRDASMDASVQMVGFGLAKILGKLTNQIPQRQ